ncbi:MAG: hypothetical protein PVJ57_16005 [Phycisphaerae bacterium]|jgi:hypothetical protein
MTPTQARDHVCSLATADTEAALQVARGIDDPWFACQALAWAARFAPDERVEAIVAEALTVGHRHADPYKVVGSTAWPIRALVERGRTNRIAPILEEMLDRVPRIEPPAGRSEAVFLLFQAVFPAGRNWWARVLDVLIAVSDPGTHWRQARNTRDALLMVAEEDPGFAADCANRLSNKRNRRRIEQCLSRHDTQTRRPFFWKPDSPYAGEPG